AGADRGPRRPPRRGDGAPSGHAPLPRGRPAREVAPPPERPDDHAAKHVQPGRSDVCFPCKEDQTMSDMTGEPTFRLDLTAAQLKVTHTALKTMLDGFGHEEHDVQDVVREVLDKLPSEHDVRAIDLGRELAKRRERLDAA